MKKKFVKSFISAVFAVVFSGICSCVQAQNSAGPVKLTYKYPADKAVSYLVKTYNGPDNGCPGTNHAD